MSNGLKTDYNALQKVNRALRVLSSCNRLLIRAAEESKLLCEICRVIVEVAGYRLAWVGFAGQDENKTVTPAAFWGFEEGYLETVRITWADTERGRGPTGTAIRTSKPVIAKDILTEPRFAPWRAEAYKRGYASSIALPLTAGGQTLGALNIYAEEPDAFDSEEVELLSEAAGDLAYGIIALRTSKERKRAEDAVKRLGHRHDLILSASGEGIIGLDIEGNISFCNPAAGRMLGYEPGELIGKHGHSTWHHTKPDGSPYSEEECPIHGVLKDRAVNYVTNDVFWRKDGTNFPAEHISTPIIENGSLVGEVVTFKDLSERRKMEELIRYQTQHDLLTGLPNSVLFLDHLNYELAQAKSESKKLAILFLDIDRFKTVNDSFGYSSGDQLLKNIADRLKSGTRNVDTVARFGGDEFIILLPDLADSGDAVQMARKVLSAFDKPYIIDNYEIYVTISIGISIFPDDSEYANTLLKSAGIALFHAKEHGKNVYQLYSPALSIGSLETMMLENSLRQTLKRGELVIYYQPQVNLKTRQIVGAEALVRWRHPELGLLKPHYFIPLAEEIGFTAPIDEWVLRAVCAQSKAWQEEGYSPPCISVNLSARQFEQQNLSEMISEVLRDSGLCPEYLGLEITESIAMRDIKSTVSNLAALSDMGIRISIDDFGTGYSSLSYLKKLPLHKIKIDQSFIRDVKQDTDYQAIVHAIIAMAHSLKLTVIAEGVENRDQLEFLIAAGCEEVQGFLIGEPLPPAEFKDLLRSTSKDNNAQIAIARSDLISDMDESINLDKAGEQIDYLHAIVQNLPDAICSIDLDWNVRSWNSGAERMFGYKAEEIIGKSISIIIPKDIAQAEVEHCISILNAEGSMTGYETVRVSKDGRIIPVELTAIALKNGEQKITSYAAIMRDISERKTSEQKLQNSYNELESRVRERTIELADANERLRGILGSMIDAYFSLDTHWRFLEVNPVAEKYFGRSARELLGRDIRKEYPQTIKTEFYRQYEAALKREQVMHFEAFDDAAGRWFEVHAYPRPDRLEVFLRDINERKQMEENVMYQASHDVLTNLPNRALFMEHLEHEISKSGRYRSQMAVLFLDLDKFKIVNDTLGHTIGDALLRAVADRLKSSVREADIVARLGGDEYTILLPDIHAEKDVIRVVQEIYSQFKQLFIIDGHELSIGVSIGIGIFPHDGKDAETLLRNADSAMYYVKEHGRNNYAFYDGELMKVPDGTFI